MLLHEIVLSMTLKGLASIGFHLSSLQACSLKKFVHFWISSLKDTSFHSLSALNELCKVVSLFYYPTTMAHHCWKTYELKRRKNKLWYQQHNFGSTQQTKVLIKWKKSEKINSLTPYAVNKYCLPKIKYMKE